MSYFLSPALAQLRAEINAMWPGRDKASDGWVGDTSHQARVSDHNPDYSSGGIVRAIDVDKDGISTSAVIACAIGDPRVSYVIFNGRIWQRPGLYSASGWLNYTGANRHDHHIHISVRRGAAFDRDGSGWGLASTVGNIIGGGGGSLPGVDVNPPAPIEEDDLSAQAEQQIAELHALLRGPANSASYVYDEMSRRISGKVTAQVSRYEGTPSTWIQDTADGTTAALKAVALLAAQKVAIDSLTAVISGAGGDVDLAAITAAAEAGARKAIADIKATVTIESKEG